MVRDNIRKIKERISSVCSKINRNPQSITIVGVAKGRTVGQIREAITAGITDIGENRVQESFLKYKELTSDINGPLPIKWHLVGHLQTNKVKEAVKLFDLIHSVDTLRVAWEIDKQAALINKVQDILVQVNTSGEQSKFGLKPNETVEVIKEISQMKNIKVKGLMTIAPWVDDPVKLRPYFRTLRELRDKINQLSVINCPVPVLSMGMTDDFEVAIEEGATIVRLGRAIFED